MKNYWSYYSHSDAWNCSWVLSLRDNSQESIEKSINISAEIIRLLHYYELAMFFPPRVLVDQGINWIVENYRKNVSRFLATGGDEFDNLGKRNFANEIWRDLGDFIRANQDEYRGTMTTVSIYDANGQLKKTHLGSNFQLLRSALSSDKDFYPFTGHSPLYLSFGFPVGEKRSLFFLMDSKCSIWFEQVRDFQNAGNIEEEFVDNRPIAYRLTPRLNSLLRDLRILADKYGADFIFNDSRLDVSYINPRELTPNGILLDGKIIYEEDVRQEKVMLPR